MQIDQKPIRRYNQNLYRSWKHVALPKHGQSDNIGKVPHILNTNSVQTSTKRQPVMFDEAQRRMFKQNKATMNQITQVTRNY